MITILFVGSNPSNASTVDIAFHASTKSSKILTEWCKDIEGAKMHVNVCDVKTEGNKPLTQAQIDENLLLLKFKVTVANADRVVALGKAAAKALTLLGVEQYEMPHPSGRNRKLNDKAWVAEKVKALQNYCLEGPSKIPRSSN